MQKSIWMIDMITISRIKPFIFLTAAILIGCQDNTAEQNLQPISDHAKTNTALSDDPKNARQNAHEFESLFNELDTSDTQEIQSPQLITTADGKAKLNWSYIDTKTKKANLQDFNYPFLIDSEPVMNYANAFNISAKQAQHSMALSMASPEVLGKIVDQLGNRYIAHQFRDGSNPALIIQVTPNIVNERHSYIISDKFAEGLELPIEIVSAQNSQ
ncbi:hypothetical protein EJK53_2038 [Moraxella catarrhalis]|uniref:Lipoprotein n=1 Tax=Moraxella catarrhalis TaxID=480 RepID=A0A3S9QDW5_MORCA|nr:hypothetical protein [Moraxella catarrhalis]AZQ92931.1 hypothetical protein EJK53_2038 [Moraxella catarrhalis]